MHKRGGFCLGYVAEVAVSDDHLIVAQRVHQAITDNGSLTTMTEAVERECGQRSQAVLARLRILFDGSDQGSAGAGN